MVPRSIYLNLLARAFSYTSQPIDVLPCRAFPPKLVCKFRHSSPVSRFELFLLVWIQDHGVIALLRASLDLQNLIIGIVLAMMTHIAPLKILTTRSKKRKGKKPNLGLWSQFRY